MTKHPTAILLSALVALLGVLALAGPAHAVSGGGEAPFAVTPAPGPDGSVRSYFTLDGRAGETLREQIVISNLDKRAETLKLSASRGATAPNTGAAFVGAFERCGGTACWISGLPAELSLGVGESRTLGFEVHVPAGTADKQYLAGVTVRPAHAAAPVQVGSGKGATAQAVVINEVTVGVAVTVGTHLHTELGIDDVTGGVTGATSLLNVKVSDPGQTFVHGTGAAVCTTAKGDLRFPVGVNTVLPGDSGTVQVTAAGLPAGDSECSVTISYCSGAKATWQGTVTVPTGRVVKRVQVAPGVYAAVPANHLPTWARILIVAGGAVIVALLLTVVVLIARRRRLQTA